MIEVELIGNRWIRNDDTFTIIRQDRFVLEYREGNHRVLIEVEPGIPNLAVYAESIKAWEIPFEDETLTAEDQTRIVNNIRMAFDATQYAYSIE
jgi:Immunity protein 74